MSHSNINERCFGGIPPRAYSGGIRIKACQQCDVETFGIAGCYSVCEQEDPPDIDDDCILHLCLTCAAPYIALDALRA